MTQPKVPVERLAEEVAVECKLSADAAGLLRKGESWPEYFDRLIAAEHFDDAFRFAAYALPKPLAVWWGALCLWSATRPTPPPEVDAILRVIVAWLREPSEENRRAVERAGNVVKFGKPAGSLALAVFASGGSIAPADLPPVEPAPDLTAKSVALTVSLLLKQGGDRVATRRGFLALARDVGAGKRPSELPFGLPTPAKAEKASAPTRPEDSAMDQSVGKDFVSRESPTIPVAPAPAADRPVPRKDDDGWAGLPRTASSGKPRPTPRPPVTDDESIGKFDEP